MPLSVFRAKPAQYSFLNRAKSFRVWCEAAIWKWVKRATQSCISALQHCFVLWSRHSCSKVPQENHKDFIGLAIVALLGACVINKLPLDLVLFDGHVATLLRLTVCSLILDQGLSAIQVHIIKLSLQGNPLNSIRISRLGDCNGVQSLKHWCAQFKNCDCSASLDHFYRTCTTSELVSGLNPGLPLYCNCHAEQRCCCMAIALKQWLPGIETMTR